MTISPGPWRKSSTMFAVEDANGRLLFSSREATDQDEDLAALAPELLDALKDAMKLIDALFPGVRHLAIQDYAMLNDVPLKIREVLNKTSEE